MAIESIAKTLGTGSGIDISALVGSLIEASFAAKNEQLTTKSEALTAKISKVSELKSGIADFATALSQLTAGGTLATQPTSSNSGIVGVTRLPGADLSGLSASVEVRQLAQGQVASTAAFAGGAGQAVPTGTLTLTFGKATVADGKMTGFTAGPAAPVEIAISSTDATVDGVARAINAANKGLTATVVTDSSGARLVVKSATGAAQAFELEGSAGLEAFDIGRTASTSIIATAAQDALVSVDGVEVGYPTNSISSLVPGVRLDLASAAPGIRVSIGSKRPTEALGQSITNLVDTYNQVFTMVKAATNAIDGPLRQDPAAKDLLRQLKGLTLKVLNPAAAAGAPRTLADLGVGTQRDGTLSLDPARVATVLQTFPREVEAIFAQGAGITAAMSAISAAATSKTAGLGASETTYAKAKDDLAEDKDDVLVATERLRNRMTQQFAAMDAKVAAYKSTQTFLQQQVDAWNAGD
jgi:flagellar hook-associated protein 2